LEQRPAVLILHDGELSELRRVVAGLEVELHERLGAPAGPDRARSWDLVLGTPRRLIELDGGAGRPASRIAALAGDSRTARAMLARAGVRVLVRLPVHPAALRLLVLHSVYRGPERRRTPRAGVGAPVLIRSGLRRRKALLVDLSVRGCRLFMTEPLPEGRRLSLAIPAELAGGRPLSLQGVAGRVAEADPRMPGVQAAVVFFEGVSARDERRLAEIVALHAQSPAVCPPGRDVPLADPAAWPDGPAALAALPGEDDRELDPDLDPELEVDEEDARAPERRAGPRHAFADPVLALGGEAARVLLGRDLSAGGMRVDPHPGLGVGDELQLALHLGVRREPLVVRARVERDDGEQGFVLVFHGLDAADRRELEGMLELLPMIEMPDSGEATGGLVVSEILGAAPASAGPP
jgi:hypothetical protein